MTIHKSQGSEYPAVILAVHKRQALHHALRCRNLLYTGITRGRKLVVLVGTTKSRWPWPWVVDRHQPALHCLAQALARGRPAGRGSMVMKHEG